MTTIETAMDYVRWRTILPPQKLRSEMQTRQEQGRENRFYVHEVFTEDEIKKLGSQQTAPRLSAMAHRNASEFYRIIIARVMNVKESAEEAEKIPARPTLSTEKSGRPQNKESGSSFMRRTFLGMRLSHSGDSLRHLWILSKNLSRKWTILRKWQ